MVKIAILGSTGMLGNAVAKHFSNTEHEIFTSFRNEDVSFGDNKFFYDPIDSGVELPFDCDYVINCIGVIKPFIDVDPQASIYLNSLFPRELADYCNKTNKKLIHITTDCVFSGQDGDYSETSNHDCLDFYGKTKSLGEPENCMVIRTSIIGEEIHKDASLIAWVKSMKGKEVNGFTNHDWNGVTTKQSAQICQSVIEDNLYTNGLYHLCSNKVNKYELVSYINERFDLDLSINPVETDFSVDRTMKSETELGQTLSGKLQTVKEQIFNL
jgi:dTDP-4-dehydrorhamnose reductase